LKRVCLFSTEGLTLTTKTWLWPVAALLFLGPTEAAAANLIVNGSFENVPSNATGQGLMPSDWVAVQSRPDTWRNDGSYGLAPGGFGDFTGVTAFDGIRWVAGASLPFLPEEFGQQLASALIPGQAYDMTAYLHEALRSDLQNSGSYEISLQTSHSVATPQLVLGTLSPFAGSLTHWQLATLHFVAPAGADTHPFLLFTPVSSGSGTAYPGLDDVSLTVSSVPEPASWLLMAAGLATLAGSHRARLMCSVPGFSRAIKR
jgi:hypothetical protein